MNIKKKESIGDRMKRLIISGEYKNLVDKKTEHEPIITRSPSNKDPSINKKRIFPTTSWLDKSLPQQDR